MARAIFALQRLPLEHVACLEATRDSVHSPRAFKKKTSALIGSQLPTQTHTHTHVKVASYTAQCERAHDRGTQSLGKQSRSAAADESGTSAAPPCATLGSHTPCTATRHQCASYCIASKRVDTELYMMQGASPHAHNRVHAG